MLSVSSILLFICCAVAGSFLGGASAFVVPPSIGISHRNHVMTIATTTAPPISLLDKSSKCCHEKDNLTVLFKKRPSSAKNNGDKPKSKGFASALRELRENSFPYAGTIRPGKQSPQKIVLDESIMKPDYAEDGIVSIYWCCESVIQSVSQSVHV